MPIKVRLQDVCRHLDYLSLMAAPTSPLDAGVADWERVRVLVDESPVGKLVQMGMALTTQGWQKLTSVTNALIRTPPWLTHFACTALQLSNIASVMYGRGVGHIPLQEVTLWDFSCGGEVREDQSTLQRSDWKTQEVKD